ncbi:MAG: PFL family protein [Aerococcus sp.]|nr:PFL family protein [Aerococcus sp.]
MDTRHIEEALRMVRDEKLDIRTTTIGLSLLDCMDTDIERVAEKVYQKAVNVAGNLVETANRIGRRYGVPIINKRVAVTPIAIIGEPTGADDYTPIAIALDKAAKEIGIDFIGGFSAICQGGMSSADETLIRSLPHALAVTDRVCASVNVGNSRQGLNMDAVKLLGSTIKDVAEATKDQDSFGCVKLVVFANAVEDNPFMAGAFHGISQPERVLHVGVSGPGTVKSALEKHREADFQTMIEVIQQTAFKITRMGELIGKEVADEMGLTFGSIDLSLAPTPAVGDSVARILEEIGIGEAGGHGTTAALALLNDAVKKGGLMASTHVGGLSGAFIPVSEDEGMFKAAERGTLTIDKLEAMTCVCSVGLDMIAIPGDTPASTISAMIADEAMIGIINSKTTAARLIPVVGKTVGDTAEFGGLLGSAPIMPVHNNDASAFIERGGRIAAPVHSFKN